VSADAAVSPSAGELTVAGGSRVGRRATAVAVAAGCALVLLAAADLSLGIPGLGLHTVWDALTGTAGQTDHVLVWQSRLPRFVLGALAGALLALAGVLMQDGMRNPLAGPELLGVSSGAAAVMAAITVFSLPVAPGLQPALALGGGLLGGGAVVWASRHGQHPARVILIGVAVSALLNAVITTIISLGSQDTVALFYSYLVGTLQDRTWQQVLLVLSWLPAAAIGYALARRLNILQLGDTVATGLGVRAGRLRTGILLLAIAAVCSVVATCGPIGYVSLLAPHIVRRALGARDARLVLPTAMLAGAVVLTAADLVARVLLGQLEVPAGIWITLLGGPLLLLILGKRLGR
jgi:iron complex transport system permease protein